MSADPYHGSINSLEPASWNRYSYVQADPINRTDRSGLCGVIVGGITQSENAAFSELAESAGAMQAYPYAGLDQVESVKKVISIPPTDELMRALVDAAATDGPINLVAYSGGAAALAAALEMMGPSFLNRIESITYISPGMVGTLPTGPWKTNVLLGTGVADVLATIGTIFPQGQPFYTSDCSHTDTACLVAAAARAGLLDALHNGGPCKDPKVYRETPIFFASSPPNINPKWFGPMPDLTMLEIGLDMEYVDSTISYSLDSVSSTITYQM